MDEYRTRAIAKFKEKYLASGKDPVIENSDQGQVFFYELKAAEPGMNKYVWESRPDYDDKDGESAGQLAYDELESDGYEIAFTAEELELIVNADFSNAEERDQYWNSYDASIEILGD